MNYQLVSKLLGKISILVGACMLLSVPWAFKLLGGQWQYEAKGVVGLLIATAICMIVGAVFHHLGRNSQGQLFRKEAMAVVGLSWVLATVLGGLPFFFSHTMRAVDTPMSLVDSMFEAQSGFSTTGATVLSELQDRTMVPRCILFWRSFTHYLGGLGIIVLFVVILGQGSAGKAMMRAEMPGPSQTSHQARMQQTAWTLFYVYTGFNVVLTLLLWLEGVPMFDSICHAFGTMATGGFSTYNASAGHFTTDPNLNGGLIEMTLTLFMIIAGTNFMLFYLCAFRGPKALLGDLEWRTYIAIIAVSTVLILLTGLYSGNFNYYGTSDNPVNARHLTTDQPIHEAEPAPLSVAARSSLFQVVSIMTTTGFCTDEFEDWNAFACGLLILLMFVGGCAGSTGGGMKVVRHILGFKILSLEIERSFRPNVVRPLKYDNEVVEEQGLRLSIPVYFALIAIIFSLSWLFVLGLEPSSTWTEAGHNAEHKMIDSASSVAATLNNIGPGLGLIGARQNYGNFTAPSKLLFIWLMMLGRLELFVILVLCVPGFWRSY